MARIFWCVTIVCLTILVVGCSETPVNEKVKDLDVSEPEIEFGNPVEPGAATTGGDNATDAKSADTDAKAGAGAKVKDSPDAVKDAGNSSLEFAPPTNAPDSGNEAKEKPKDAD